ncbi:MAG: polysaccharide biosynthesis protein [Gemmatimonadaceae bacterium]|nr:polysaccharide biosynthesis protein [Gemmatimonadaceae bacterium]
MTGTEGRGPAAGERAVGTGQRTHTDAEARPGLDLRLVYRAYRHRRPVLFVLHLVLVVTSYALAFVLRFDRMIPDAYLGTFWITLVPLLIYRLSAFAFFRLYSGWWRYVGMRDMVALLKAVALSSMLFIATLVFMGEAYTFPRSVLVIDAVFTVVLIGGARFALRAYRERRRPMAAAAPRLRRVIIIGAGDAGEMLLREMRNNPALGYLPVGFVDDDSHKIGFHIHGVPVLGTSSELGALLARHAADELIISIPSATREQIQAIVDRCVATKLPFKILPAIAALAGRVQISQVRPVRVEDLLGRDPVDLDTSLIHADIAGRRVLVTGAGGSIGSELARQIAAYDPASIILFERGENALFLIEQELRRKHPTLQVHPVIGDVREWADVERVFRLHHPDLVYHAAAFKHVPMMEMHIAHAVHNNVFGTRNVAVAAAEHGAKFVLISTDKAVSPTNVMGATKRLAEKLVLSLSSARAQHFVAVRFGNVLGSNGSVVPLFTEQIAEGGPVTVTHPEVSRYFMTIPEAVQLVLQASVLAEARDKIVMLEMGAPVKIVDLARNLIRLSGLEPDVDIPIVFTGLRPGEKLHEQLTSETEETLPTRYDKIRIVRTDAPRPLDHALDQLWEAVVARDDRMILRKLQELVPEFSPQAALIASVRDRASGEARAASRNVG